MAVNRQLLWAAALMSACLVAGCENLRHWHGDETSDPEYVLKIEIPSSATDIDKQFDPAIAYDIKFLMPDDQWRSYATKYYSADKLTAKPLAGEEIPPVCLAREGMALTQWSASGGIPYLNASDATARRFFWAVPGCRPDQAYVHWRLIPPDTAPVSSTG
ncbi:MAG: hypothetical protein H6523_03960 [Mycolicibacterium sp.]|nr:hypothetical protein [Mycolicibacterium sp.]